MALYKRNKVNPLGGCLPTLLQMPIWFALFRTLRASPELYRADFFGWIHDLSSPDPYYITPVVMGGMMFLQQRFTPMAGDSAQAKMMMYFMPIMFTGFMLFLPSGLTLYILVNTVLSIAHQAIIHRRRTKQGA
jgi:YidC/Oxa1 family membrane protein insertase